MYIRPTRRVFPKSCMHACILLAIVQKNFFEKHACNKKKGLSDLKFLTGFPVVATERPVADLGG